MNTRENYMDAVAGRYERVFPVARYADELKEAGATMTYDPATMKATLNPNNNLWSGRTCLTTVTSRPTCSTKTPGLRATRTRPGSSL